MGHCNSVNLPSPAETPARIAALMTVAVKDRDMSGPRRVDVKIQSCVRICGSGNVVRTGEKREPASATGGANAETKAERNEQETNSESQLQSGTKRQAESVRREIGERIDTVNVLTCR